MNKNLKLLALFIIFALHTASGFTQDTKSGFSEIAAIEHIVNSRVDFGLKVKSGRRPTYPKSALRDDIQGAVVFTIKIDKNGNVDDFRAVSSPHEFLSLAVRSAARNWLFEPHIVNGEPSEIEVTSQYIFYLLP